ncbi:MAG: LacI family DNA-binding transcriptional regulator [Spirochaetia bacterium]|nr:LacI family DNA-binding transcriptional regulator [Spirochaetia bacterium]
MKALPNIRDLARKTGLSTATVSRVLNQKPGVDAATRLRVEKAVADLSYKRRPVGRTHRLTRKAIGILYNRREDHLHLSDAVYHEMVEHLHFLLGKRGYELIPIETYWEEKNDPAVAAYLKRRISLENLQGIFIYLELHHDPLLDYLRKKTLPIVHLQKHFENPFPDPWIAFDHRSGTMEAMAHLLSLGHRKIALISGKPDAGYIQEREAGYREALEQKNIPFEGALVKRILGGSAQSGYEAMKLFLSEKKSFSAVITYNDLTALGVLRALHEKKIRVPEDVSVVGFDDAIYSRTAIPSLTTVGQDFKRMAREGVAALFDLRGGARKPTQTLLPTRLILRESTSDA